MSFFDDSHVTGIGLQGSAGPTVSLGELTAQSIQQQFRVDSGLALDTELRNRWLESLRKAQISHTDDSDPDRFAYAAFAQTLHGQPIDVTDLNPWEGDLTERFKGMANANEAIKKLNNPDIKSFEQILEEVSQMQRETEEETASMYERTGTGRFVASLVGSVIGSFTTRDPLNIITAPLGAGRHIATKIATDMGVAAAVTGYTELADVAPARQIVGLPERNPLFNIGAAAFGAGVIRGGLEGIGYGVRRLRGEDINFDLRDSQLAQMFEENIEKPSARAGASILDDVKFIERNNPYGEGHQANVRFLAELQSVQRAMNGEPMTAVARVLPPIPYESLKKAADFEIVREQAPEIYGKMEAAQARVATLSQITDDIENTVPVYRAGEGAAGGWFTTSREYAQQLAERDKVPLWEARISKDDPVFRDADELDPGRQLTYQRDFAPEDILNAKPVGTKASTASRTANAEYETAYRAVEAEAARIRTQQAAVESAQRRESASILASEGLPFTGPLLRYDSVESLVERINKFNDTLDERTAARFVRESIGEGEEKIEVEVWERDGGIDIGLRDPVDPNFRFETDEGEMTVAQAMRDLQDDTDLVEAIKGCAI